MNNPSVSAGADQIKGANHPKRTRTGAEEQEKASAKRTEQLRRRQPNLRARLGQGQRVECERSKDWHDSEQPERHEQQLVTLI